VGRIFSLDQDDASLFQLNDDVDGEQGSSAARSSFTLPYLDFG
jgi:hypothetical protein